LPLRQFIEREKRERGRVVATQAYPKIRGNVLDRYKRLYLVCIGENYMLFILPVASVGNHNKSYQNNRDSKTIRSPRQ